MHLPLKLMVSVFHLAPFPPPPPLGTPKPYNLQGCETFFLKKLKINYVLTNFSLPGIQILMKINSGCEYFTLCESFDAKKFHGHSIRVCRPINNFKGLQMYTETEF